MTAQYVQGNVVRCSTIDSSQRIRGFTDVTTGTLVDPPAVTFTLTKPDATIVTYTYGTDSQLVRESTGVYHVDVSLTQTGTWSYAFASTGGNAARAHNSFTVIA